MDETGPAQAGAGCPGGARVAAGVPADGNPETCWSPCSLTRSTASGHLAADLLGALVLHARQPPPGPCDPSAASSSASSPSIGSGTGGWPYTGIRPDITCD